MGRFYKEWAAERQKWLAHTIGVIAVLLCCIPVSADDTMLQ